MAFEHPHEAGDLVAVGILRDVLDAELLGAKAHALRHPPGDDRDANAGAAQQRDAQAVLDVVPLELDALAVDVAEVDAAVGHHAVDVERDEPDRRARAPDRSPRHPVPDVDGAQNQIVELVERHHVRAVARRADPDRDASP